MISFDTYRLLAVYIYDIWIIATIMHRIFKQKLKDAYPFFI